MSFLLSAELLESATKIKSWHTSAVFSMNQVKENYTSLATQLEAMKTNPNYTSEDCAEVENMLVSIVDLARSLLPTE